MSSLDSVSRSSLGRVASRLNFDEGQSAIERTNRVNRALRSARRRRARRSARILEPVLSRHPEVVAREFYNRQRNRQIAHDLDVESRRITREMSLQPNMFAAEHIASQGLRRLEAISMGRRPSPTAAERERAAYTLAVRSINSLYDKMELAPPEEQERLIETRRRIINNVKSEAQREDLNTRLTNILRLFQRTVARRSR